MYTTTAHIKVRTLKMLHSMTLVKSKYQRKCFLISQTKYMLWVLKSAVSMIGKKIFTIYNQKIVCLKM